MVSRFPNAVTRFRSQFRSYGICDGRNGTGVGFLRECLFPFAFLIPPAAPSSLIFLSQTVGGIDTGQAPASVRAPFQGYMRSRQYWLGMVENLSKGRKPLKMSWSSNIRDFTNV